jgi:hypothetical protein
MFNNMDILANSLLVLFALASLVSNVYWLGLSTLTGSIAALLYYLFFIDAIQWHYVVFAVIFIGVNVYKMWHLHQAKSYLHFSQNELLLHQQVFSDLSPEHYMTLMKIAVWRDVHAGEVLIKQGESVAYLSLVFKGIVKVDMGSNHYIQIRDGQFIGEMSYVSGNPGSGTVIAEEQSLLVEWPQVVLKEMVSQNNVIGNCFQTLFNADLMKKLGD